MEFFPTSRIFLEIGPFNITWYALCSLAGILTCYALSMKTLKKMGYNTELMENYFYLMLPTAYIGARIWYVMFEWRSYIKNPISVFFIWEGGLAFHGGVIAAVILGYFYCKHYQINPRRFADACLPNLLIGQMIGRWGNFMNQEAYGAIVSKESLSWLPEFISERMYINGAYRQPTFLYEGIGNLIGWIIIRFFFKKYGRKKRGDMAYAYLMWYGLVRIIVEGMRTDSLYIGPFRIAQIISILFMVLGLLGLLGVYDKLFKKTWMFHDEKPVVLFDVDGTLLDTTQLSLDSFRYVIQKHCPELTFTDKQLKKYLGISVETAMRELFPEKDAQELVKEYRSYYEEHRFAVQAMPQTAETLAALKSEGYLIGAVSNRDEATVKQDLESCKLTACFDTIICDEQVEKAKPDPEGLFKAVASLHRSHDDLVYVGNCDVDVAMAKSISAYSVGVLFDAEGAEQMREAKPCAMIESMNQLIELLKEDHEWSDNSTL